MSGVLHRPDKYSRLWIRQSTFRSANLLSIPHSVPSPSGRGLGGLRSDEGLLTFSLPSSSLNFPCPPTPVSVITLYMIRQVRFDKKQRVVDELVRRIESGLMEDGFLLPGEHQLAQEFNVSRGTLREALAELKRRKYIATQSGVGSIVTFDGVVLDQRSGWAQALADTGALINTEVLRLEAVTRTDLSAVFGSDQFILLERRRRSNDGTLVSLERSLMPANGGLESLPRVGLIDNSLTITLAAYGYIGERGDQWLGAEPLNAEDAELLGRPPGTVFLKALRTTYDRQNRFMEQVESLLDPVHFRLHLQFGESK